MGVLGGLAARGRPHDEVWRILEVEQPVCDVGAGRLLPRRACLPRASARSGARGRGRREHACGDRGAAATATSTCSAPRRRWGIAKPAAGFFARVIDLVGSEPAEDRVRGRPCRQRHRAGAGRRAGRRPRPTRGPWGYLHDAAGRRAPNPLARRAAGGAAVSFRVGIGVDAHALAEGVPLVLGGVRLDHPTRARRSLRRRRARARAHDALLGAAGLGDIGSLFPVGRRALPRRRQRSTSCARHTARCRQPGWTLVNADCVLVGEEPRIAAHREQMRGRLSARTREAARSNVRATTTDRLGFTGRGEGLAAHAVALLER